MKHCSVRRFISSPFRRMKRVLVLTLALSLPCAWVCADETAAKSKPWLPRTYRQVEYESTDIVGICHVKDTTYFVNDCSDRSFFNEPAVAKNVSMFNDAFAMNADVKTALYLVESTRTIDLRKPLPQESTLYQYLCENLKVDYQDHLKIDTLGRYFDLFYETDHHWNYKGSYQGYQDVVRMLLGKDAPLCKPDETVVFPFIFNGNSAKRLSMPIAQQPFTVYRFDSLPAQDVSVNHKKQTPDHMEAYFSGKYNQAVMFDHYSYFYGPGKALVRRATNREQLPNLLIIGNSLVRGIEKLLTYNFNTVYTIEPKYYTRDIDTLSIKAFTEENDIDYILLLSDAMLYNNTMTILP